MPRQGMPLRLVLLPFLAVILLATAGFATPAPASYSYVATDLGTIGDDASYAREINNSGQVVGYTRPKGKPGHALLWQRGTLIDLHPVGAAGTPVGSYAAAINDAGVVGGSSGIRPVLWRDGAMEVLDSLSNGTSEVLGINDAGQAVGYSFGTDKKGRAVVWSNGTISELEGPPGYQDSVAFDVNDAGQIVGRVITAKGEQAVLWQDGRISELGTFGGPGGSAVAIDEAGRAFGYAETADGERHAFVWQQGVMTDLGTLGGAFSIATGGNRHGSIVGYSNVSQSNPESHAFITTGPGSPLVELNTLVDPASGWTFATAWDINDAGQIVGYGEHNGKTRAYLLTPATLPKMPNTGGGYGATRHAGDAAALALLAIFPIGAFALGRAKRR